ncbi:type VII secretion protein EccB [Amycolatopsis acidicola]|uniref:Type VII secretion protein EccB n=1 Tax=Amycolatopsis acidicola TaxID=2596893 RepID=A0A5N0VPX1_9PSEU|nr:type VII secretion protein EccB [Amycolatopsis acidicola]KAA9166892.1 type VII secretion protein EccB [Amycolatopsis acidicola]
MPTRRDQLQAYQFMMQRVTSALIVHETDPEVTPLRRGVGAVFAGVMIAVLVAAGFGVYGVFTGVGGTSWKSDGAVIIERETGATYVYRSGTLQPALNYASARLLSGESTVTTYRVSGEDLAGLPRKATVGIPGAPQSLPESDRLTGTPWTMCSVLSTSSAGTQTTTTTLLVGQDLSGGRALNDQALLVRDDLDGTNYLLWNDHRYRITDANATRSLFGAGVSPVAVGSAWLNGLPAGQDIGAIDVPGRGSPSALLSGFSVGDIVYYPINQGLQYYLVRTDGLASLSELQVRILQGQYSVQPKQIPASAANAAPVSTALAPAAGEAAPPTRPPALTSSDTTTLCARTGDARTAPVISVGGNNGQLAAGIQTTQQSGAGTKLADRVLVPPGGVAVVRALPSETATAGAYNLVTDLGLRYPVPSAKALEALGYSESQAVDMPAALVQRIPQGPTLDFAPAAMPATPQS